MKTIGIGLGAIVSIVFLIFVLLLVKFDVGDILYSMLGAAFVSIFASGLAITKNIESFKVSTIVLLSIMSGAAGWFVSLMFLKITSVTLYGITALAFDLIIGVISAISVSSLLIERFKQMDAVQ